MIIIWLSSHCVKKTILEREKSMYLNQLTPQGKYLEYVPEELINDGIDPAVFTSLSYYLTPKMRMDQYIGYIQGLINLQEIIQGTHKNAADGTKSAWFTTDKIVDVRLFFRKKNKSDDNKTLGSKMRLYSIGRPYNARNSSGDNMTVQSLDSGFIKYNTYRDPEMDFQNAISKTMLYRALYSIGGRASIRKINEVDGATNEKYKWVSAIRPLRCDDTNWDDYTHILHPAAIAAGITNHEGFFADFGGNASLDELMEALLEASSLDDLSDRLYNIRGFELSQSEVDEIIDASNNPDANLSDTDDFQNAEGINIVETMRVLYDILSN